MTYDTDEYDDEPTAPEAPAHQVVNASQTHRATDLPEPAAADAPKRVYTTPPLTKAVSRVNRAKAALERGQKAHERITKLTADLPDLDALHAEHAAAVAALNELL